MNRRTHRLALSLLVISLAVLACAGVETTATVSNIRMTTDDTGDTETSMYAPEDDFYVFADLANIQVGALIQARWYAADVQELERNFEINTSDYRYEEGIDYVFFQLGTSDGGPWPPGTYRVELYLEGTKVGEQSFSVG